MVGVLIGLVGLAATVAGAIGTVAYDQWARTDPTAEGTMPGRVQFDAHDATYEILLTRRRGANLESEASRTSCDVELADGRVVSIDGRFQAVSVSGGGTATVGSFDAVPGPTVVRCRGADEGRRFVVDAVSTSERWLSRSMWGGVIVLAVGVGILLLGLFWRRPPS